MPEASGRVRAPVELVPGLLCVGIFVVLAASEGGFAITSWAPTGIFLLGLLLAVGYAYRERLRSLSQASRIALAFLAGYVVWNFASIAWADVQGVAWDGANRTLFYLVVYALFSVVLWRPSSAAILLGTYSVALAALGAGVFLDAAGSADPALSFINARFAEPTGYANAVAALFVGGFWPAIFLASRRETPWPLRGLLLAVAALLVQLALLPQSRGSLIVFPLAVLIYLAVVPNRLRAFLFLALAGVATALVAPSTLDVFSAADAGSNVGAALDQARDAMLISFVLLILVGTAIALVDRLREVPERVARAAGRGAAVLAVAGAVVAGVAAVSAVGDPINWADERWEDFKNDYDEGGFGSSRFSGDLGSSRYDFWRVAVEDQIPEAPLIGSGSDSFAVSYLQNREASEDPIYPHSLPIRVVAGTGIIGALLLLGFVISATLAAARTRLGAETSLGRGVAGVSLATVAYFALHSGGDWLWTFTGITAPVFAWLAIAANVSRPAASEEPPRAAAGGNRAGRIAAGVAGAVAVGFATVSLLLPWIAARDIDIAIEQWPTSPEAAFERLDRARELNFLSARPDLVAGAIAVKLDDFERGRVAFTRALEREPQSWYALLELAALDGLDGRWASARSRLNQASILNPKEPLIAMAMRATLRKKPFPPQRIDRELLDSVCARVGPTEETPFCQ